MSKNSVYKTDQSLLFPTEMTLPKTEFEKNYWRCLHNRSQDQSYNFSVVIPKSWRPVDVPADPPTTQEPFLTLALFRALEGARGELEVSAALLDREVAPADWLDLFLEQGGEETICRRTAETKGGAVADILTRKVTDEGTVVSRWTAIKDGGNRGGRIFLVQCRSLEGDYRALAETFSIAVRNFQLLHPGEWPLAESLRTFSLAKPADFLMMYPESWSLRQGANSNKDVLELELSPTAGGPALGRISFVVIARHLEKDPSNLLKHYLEEIRRHGCSANPLALTAGIPHSGFDSVWNATGEVPGGIGEQHRMESNNECGTPLSATAEIRIFIGCNKDAWFLVALLGTARKTIPGVWAINKRAFAIVTEFIKTQPSPV